MDKEIIDEVVEYLIPIHNNLAARISVLYRVTKNDMNSINLFKEKQIFDNKKIAKKIKKTIDPEMYKKIQEICDYFEAIYIAHKLSQ